MSPTARSLRYLRERQCIATVVERFNPGAKVRVDFLGFGDILALEPGRHGVLAVQVTTTSNMAARIKKIESEALARNVTAWLSAGNRIRVHGWSLKGPRGRRKTWQVIDVLVGADSG